MELFGRCLVKKLAMVRGTGTTSAVSIVLGHPHKERKKELPEKEEKGA